MKTGAKYIIIAFVMAVFFAAPRARAFQDTQPGSLDERIRSLRSTINGDIMAPPVVILGSGDQIIFSFDCLEDDRSYFRIRLTHCNADWQPSSLIDSEIFDGFNEYVIDDYDFSRGTTVNYVNYSFAIPNQDMQPLVSGNYLVSLYREDEPERTLAQWRFMVCEQTAKISSMLTSRTDKDYNDAHQQLSITVDTDRDNVPDPFNDLIVMVQQNGRLDNEVALRHPLRMSGRTAVYEHQAPLIFEAGNEYRRFETVTLDYPGMKVESIGYLDPYYHATLEPDTVRAKSLYSYDSTQNGRFLVREYDSDQADTQADYVVVHFTLDMPEAPGTMIFIDGDLTSRRFDDSSLMTYNHSTGRYEKAMLLKQGSYNYQYLAVPPGKKRGYTSIIEGDKYQTVNEYLVKVYTRLPGERYDRLIGVNRIVFDR